MHCIGKCLLWPVTRKEHGAGDVLLSLPLFDVAVDVWAVPNFHPTQPTDEFQST